jgi:hypothetical protein
MFSFQAQGINRVEIPSAASSVVPSCLVYNQSSDSVATEQFQYCYIKVQTLQVFLGKVPPIGVPGTTPTAEVTFLLLLSIVILVI